MSEPNLSGALICSGAFLDYENYQSIPRLGRPLPVRIVQVITPTCNLLAALGSPFRGVSQILQSPAWGAIREDSQIHRGANGRRPIDYRGRMTPATYTGNIEVLKGKRALIMEIPSPSPIIQEPGIPCLVAQFNDTELLFRGVRMGFGWHEFRVSDFTRDA